MKRITKILYAIFSMMSIMVLGYAPNALAEKMELATDTLKIYGLGQQTKSDTSFKRIKPNFPGKFQITELSITYNGKGNSQSLLILEEGGDTLVSKEVTNGLNPSELSYVRLNLFDGKNYIIKHGDKEWKLALAGKQDVKETNDSLIISKAKTFDIPQWRIDEGFAISASATETEVSDYLNRISNNIDDNMKSGTPWWMFLIIAVLGIVCVCLILPKFIRVLSCKNAKKQKDKPKQSNKSKEKDDLDPSIQTVESPSNSESPKLKDKDAADKKDLDALKERLNSLMPEDKELSDEKKLAKLKVLLDNGRKASEDLRHISKCLNVNDENGSHLCDAIENLKNTKSQLSQGLKESPAKVCDELLKKIQSKDNKILNDVVAAAQKEKGANQFEVMLKVIDLLSSKVKDERAPLPNIEQPIEITDKQLNNVNNIHVLKKWFLDKLISAGISDIDRNKDITYNLQSLSERLNKSQENTPRKSDGEIIDEALSNDTLTEAQKTLLLKKLIENINGKMVDSSKHIGESVSLDEFVMSVADAFQQPNSYEEAQMQTQQQNIAIVNDALGTDIASLTKDEIKNALNNIILGILQSNLSNITIQSYDDAIKALSISNEQQENLKKMQKQYEVESLNDLPKAIREKQYNDLIKSVSDKLAELLPGQHFDSAQKLVNSLLKELKEAKDSRELIAADLEERISLRDKTYTSSDEKRDILKLMCKYSDLVNNEDQNLRNQIKAKDDEINTLNDTVSNQELKINSLENNNKSLMSDSAKLIETLHGFADQILESCKTLLNPCSEDEEAQCAEIEDRLFADLASSVSRIKSFRVDKDTTPSDTREQIQELLITEISSDDSAFNTVCRYFAYSRLPFMTDTAREYGITFKRRNMSELYNAIENLYVQFGINLEVPLLFVMGVDEGDFENVTGKMYGDLDNFCQNSRNHFDNIDSTTKPSNVIVDVVNAGYSIDGKLGRKTSVLTY